MILETKSTLIMDIYLYVFNNHWYVDCQGAEPKKCPEADVPENGGLVCVTVDNKRYCKPMCNHVSST